MPLITNGLVLGPVGSPADLPADLPAYLQSIGKASWYGGYKFDRNMYASSADLLTPVTTDGASVGQILPYETAGGWSSVFRQSNNALRPAYGTNRNGKPGVYGNAVDWFLSLSSTTELNRDHTVLMSVWTPFAGNIAIYSINTNTQGLRPPTGSGGEPLVFSAGVQGTTVKKSIETTPVSGTTAAYRIGWATSGTAHHNNAPNLFRFSSGSGFSATTIHELWFVPALDPDEISAALKHLV